MKEKINVRITQGGKLLKEISDYNVLIITELERGEICSKLGVEETVILIGQLEQECDRLRKMLSNVFHLDDETISDLIKIANYHISSAEPQVTNLNGGEAQ